MVTVTISPKYQITLPAEVRQALGLHPGEKLLVEVVGGEIRLRPWRPPVRQLLRELLQAYPEEAEAVGKTTGHNAVGYIRKLRKG
ncbi:AbrB/MazE/SpoVT family DNA-binding domain-containing protein [Thermus antranikianii]|uniref:AbrB/MazE/SpoVT family DNA-binding domain-containing protein n=2 Tax=Thermus TaxID=270 RepID=A0A7V4A0E3_9DEIN|nr:AbrB/MazE/SpoVT family DNA-binding domain-containing protein [Thermus antranikianii]QWK22045.1 MAG: AbrB/MazE/SpoVT family DNA-binding domain-containing protein [Thermus antranikianii]WCM39293.1 AbrB/MazE/SpoVT family DNA-binding domain-containing protein [Thermus antranikianii]